MPDQQVGDRYVLEKKLEGGGMGTIWVALDGILNRRVAVKLMKADHLASGGLRALFEQEAKAIARIVSPHVVRIYDYGVDQNRPFIVMELLEGENLEARLARMKRFTPAAFVPVLSQIARALASAHAANIIHRDLKPANLFIARVDDDEVVKVLDFGLARFLEPASFLAGESGPMGTPCYRSPEQIQGWPRLDHRSDLWALGVVAYRALTGRLPFDSEDEIIVNAAGSRPLPQASKAVPELGPELDAFFGQALHPEPARRFQSAQELATAFTHLVEERLARPAKVLVVDDEPDMKALMRQGFRRQEREGQYQLIFAEDGEDALEKLRQHPDIDIALSDLNMPRMDGLTFLARAAEVSPLLKVVIVSAYSDMGNIRSAMNQGAFDFLVKPLDFEDLEATVAKTLKHAKDVQRMLRSVEENNLLKLFLHSGMIDRLRPLIGGVDVVGGERAEATVACVRLLAGFDPSQRNDATAEIVKAVNARFEVIVSEITARAGMVDRLVGDAVMAVFRDADHLARALEACLEIRRRLQAMARAHGEQSAYAQGVCAGVDSGDLLFANIGSRAVGRMDYAVLGEVVSAAVRLAGSASQDQILIRGGVLPHAAAKFECLEVAPRSVTTGAPFALHEVMCRKELRLTPAEELATTLRRPVRDEEPGSEDGA